MSPFRAQTLIRVVSLVLAAMTLVAACGHEPVRRVDNGHVAVSPSRDAGEMAAAVALQQLGVPYRYGGASTRGFDCSGLTQFAYARAGARIPRTTREQWRRLAPVAKNGLEVGDVLFFRIDGDISHVGLYLGGNRFVHAPASGRTVSIEDLDAPFYAQAFVRGGRP